MSEFYLVVRLFVSSQTPYFNIWKDSHAFIYLLWNFDFFFLLLQMPNADCNELKSIHTYTVHQHTHTHTYTRSGVLNVIFMNYVNWIIKHLSICCVTEIVHSSDTTHILTPSMMRWGWQYNFIDFFCNVCWGLTGAREWHICHMHIGKFGPTTETTIKNEKFKQNVLSFSSYLLRSNVCPNVFRISKYFQQMFLCCFFFWAIFCERVYVCRTHFSSFVSFCMRCWWYSC